MYTFLLTFRYLFRKLTPLIGMVAVMFCVGLIIVTASVMGGFLDKVLNSGRQVIGDVSLMAGPRGFPHYRELAKRIEALPEAEAVTWTIQTLGILKWEPQYFRGPEVRDVELVGIDGPTYAKVTGFANTIYWTADRLAALKADLPRMREAYHQSLETRKTSRRALLSLPASANALQRQAAELAAFKALREYNINYAAYMGAQHILSVYRFAKDPAAAAAHMTNPFVDFPGRDGRQSTDLPVPIVWGLEINRYNMRTADGKYLYRDPAIGRECVVTCVPISEKGSILEPKYGKFQVVNAFHTGFLVLDEKRVYIPFATAQRMTDMEEAEKVDPETGEIVGKHPARCSQLLVRAAPGVSADQLKSAIEREYDRFKRDHEMPMLSIATWQELQARYLAPIKKEKALVTMLFSLMSFVVLIMTIVVFYMIVLQKTRDIGILRSLGASRPGIASIFLVYAFVVGVLGAALGTLMAWLFVSYINEIHGWLGTRFGRDVGVAVLGVVFAVAGMIVFFALDYQLRRWGGWRGFRALLDRLWFVAAGVCIGFVLAGLAWLIAGIFLPTVLQVDDRSPFFLGGLGLMLLLALAGFWCSTRRHETYLSAMFMVGLILLASGVASGLWALDQSPALVELADMLNFSIWAKDTYYFERIPDKIDWGEVMVYDLIAVVASVAGAVVPAIIAAMVDPVRTLRYE